LSWENVNRLKDMLRFIVLLKENGKAVDGNLISVEAIADQGQMAQSVPVNFETETLSDGLIIEVRLYLEGSLNAANIFLFHAEYDVNNGLMTLYDDKLFSIN
jgi:hypothetical protein